MCAPSIGRCFRRRDPLEGGVKLNEHLAKPVINPLIKLPGRLGGRELVVLCME